MLALNDLSTHTSIGINDTSNGVFSQSLTEMMCETLMSKYNKKGKA